MRARELALVFLSALGLAVVWTWPLAADLGSRLPYDARFVPPSGSDTHIWAWDFWWARRAVSDGPGGDLPFDCHLIWAPLGHGLALHTHAFLWGILSMPLQFAFGLTAALNLFVLLLCAAAAAATWALVRHVGCSRPASALAAFAWAFSPYFAQKSLEHLCYAANPWPPLFALALIAWARADQAPWKPAFGAGVVGGALLLTEPVTAIYAGLMGLGVLLLAPRLLADVPGARDVPNPSGRRGLCSPRAWIVALASALAIGAPWILPAVRELAAMAAVGDAAALARDQLYHPRLADFVTPSGLHPWFEGLGAAAPIETAGWSGARPENAGLYVGLSILTLAAIALARSPAARAWLALATLFALLCWDPGPEPSGWISSALRELPGGQILRVPARAFPFMHLAVVVAAALGFDRLRRSMKGRGWALACAGLLAIEFWNGPVTTMDARAPAAVRAIADEAGDSGVCVLPFAGGSHVGMSWQTVHEKPVPWSYVARADPAVVRQLSSRARDLAALAAGEPITDPAALALDLEHLGIGHVLALRAEFQSPEQLDQILDAMPGWQREPDADGVSWWRRTRATDLLPRAPRSR